MTIDDRIVGSLAVVSRMGVAMPPGVHHVTVEASGYFPFDRVIRAEQAPVVLDVRLVPVPE